MRLKGNVCSKMQLPLEKYTRILTEPYWLGEHFARRLGELTQETGRANKSNKHSWQDLWLVECSRKIIPVKDQSYLKCLITGGIVHSLFEI